MLVRFYRWMMKEPEPCQNCDMLRTMLASEQYEKKQLLNTILEMGNPKEDNIRIEIPEDLKPVQVRHIPWRVRQQMLEQEDRVKAEIIRKKKKEEEEIAKLEKEMKVG